MKIILKKYDIKRPGTGRAANTPFGRVSVFNYLYFFPTIFFARRSAFEKGLINEAMGLCGTGCFPSSLCRHAYHDFTYFMQNILYFQ